MLLSETFEVMTGSTAGRRHRTMGNLANNQDSHLLTVQEKLILGSVSDGCGSQPHSEYGSQLTVNLLNMIVRRRMRRATNLNEEWFAGLYKALVKNLVRNAKSNFDDPREALNTHMMATAGGVIVLPEETIFYGAGDFTFVINGQTFVWEPADGNAPLYPVLSLAFPGDERFKFRVHRVPTADISEFIFGTDGVGDLLKVLGDTFHCIPGTETPAGPVKKIWTEDRFYENKDACGLWLNSLARDWRGPAGTLPHGGLLDDDTTLIAGRLKENVSA